MDRRPQLLFLSHLVPYPRDDGARIRTWYILAELARSFAVEGVFLTRPGVDLHPEATSALAAVSTPTVFRLPRGIGRRPWNAALRGLIRRAPYTRYLYASREATSHLQAMSDRFGVIHVDSIDLAGYLSLLDPTRVSLSHHSVESEMLYRRAASCSNPLLRWGLERQASLVGETEGRWCRRVALNVCVSDRDADVLGKNAPGASTFVAPNGVDVDYFTPSDGHVAGRGLLFVGGMDWAPNFDAVRYFVGEIQPLLSEQQRYRLTCVGRTTRAARSVRGVDWAGHLADIRPLMHRAAVVVVPLRVGAGTRLKILTAWAMGKAVVSTSLGAEGLAVRPGENILLADTPERFADAVERVEGDPILAAQLGRAGRATAEGLYDWRLIGRRLRDRYLAISESR